MVAGVRIVGRAFTKAVKQEYQASQAAASARSGNRGAGTKRAAADAYTGMTIQVPFIESDNEIRHLEKCQGDLI